MYKPLITSAKPLLRYRLAPYTFILLGEIESLGVIEYLFILFAIKDEENAPELFIASEVNAMAATLGGGSHFLGVFDPQGHWNLGASDQWANLDLFAAKALEIATTRLGLEGNPTLF